MTYQEAKQKLDEDYTIKRKAWNGSTLHKSGGDDPKYPYHMISHGEPIHSWSEEDYTATDWIAYKYTETGKEELE